MMLSRQAPTYGQSNDVKHAGRYQLTGSLMMLSMQVPIYGQSNDVKHAGRHQLTGSLMMFCSQQLDYKYYHIWKTKKYI